jgi:phage tail tape-measure protein
MDRQSKTFSGIISNMKDEIGRVAREIVGINDQGDIKEGGLFYNLKKGAESLLAWMTENKEEITAWVQNFVDQGIEAINKLIKWLQENQQTQKATWEAIKLFGKIVLEVIEFVMNVLSLLQKTLETVFYGWFMLIDKAKNYFTKLKDAWSNAIMGMKQIFFSVWDSIKSGLIDGINYFIRKINDLIRAVNKVPGVEIGKIREIGTRAEGGPVSQGSPYIVGERGPEMFVPNQSGTIIPNHQMGATFNFTFNGDVSDKNSLIAEIKQVINRELELSRYGLR